MNKEKVRELELEIEEVNKVQDEGENIDTVDGFRKFLRKQLDKINGKDKRRASEASARKTPITSEATDGGRGDHDTSDIYNFTYPERGLAVIINNEDFHLTKEFGDRPGSSYDAASLYQTFKNLGFKVWVKNNLKAWQIIEVLKLAKNGYDHAAADCFVCAILTHGSETLVTKRNLIHGTEKARHDMLFGTDGKSIATSTFVDFFTDKACPGLQGKPRLFFIQACRGEKFDDGQPILVTKLTETPIISIRNGSDRTDQGSDIDQLDTFVSDVAISSAEVQVDTTDAKGEICGKESEGDKAHNSIGPGNDMTDGQGDGGNDLPSCPTPLYKDSLIMYATPPGYYAWRRKTGAWFVQSLCTILDRPESGQKSLLNVLVQVASRVATEYQSENQSRRNMHQKKEAPVIESMLVKDIFLTTKF